MLLQKCEVVCKGISSQVCNTCWDGTTYVIANLGQTLNPHTFCGQPVAHITCYATIMTNKQRKTRVVVSLQERRDGLPKIQLISTGGDYTSRFHGLRLKCEKCRTKIVSNVK